MIPLGGIRKVIGIIEGHIKGLLSSVVFALLGSIFDM